MIRKDGKVVIHRKINYRIKTIVLRDYEIEEIYNFYENKLQLQKREQYEALLYEMLEQKYSKEFIEKLKKQEQCKIEEMIDNCIKNQDAIDNICVWDLIASYKDYFEKKYNQFKGRK